MTLRSMFAVMTASMLLLTACGEAGGNGDGGGSGLPGTLVGEGTGYIHTSVLRTGSDWLERLSISGGYDVVALNLPANELYVAGLNFLDPMDVAVYDLATFGRKDEWLWPDTVDLGRVEGLAVSPDGRHAAALLWGLGRETFLEILDLETREVVVSGFTGVSGGDMMWVSETGLLFAMDLEEQEPDFHGGIVVMDWADMIAGGDRLDYSVLVGFDQAQWDSGFGVHSFAMSADRTQMVFSRAGDLWVKDLGSAEPPHQLTTGPTPSRGAAFSPDDSLIVFVEFHRYGLESTFVIPNHRDAPILIDSATADGSHYLLNRNNLVERILAWLP